VSRLSFSVVGALLLAAAAGLAGGLATSALLGGLGLVTVAAAHGVLRLRLRSLRRQFALIGGLAVAALVAGVGLFSALMYVSSHDALLTLVLAAYASVLGLWAASLLARRVLAGVDAIGATLAGVAEGRRDVRTGVRGRDEIARLAADVDAMVERLGAEERARATLIAAVSHDLRTPITSLQVLAEAIDDGVVDPRENAARMGTHVRALAALVDDLFELTRLEARELRWSMRQVRLEALVRETVEAMRPAASAGAIAMRVEPGCDLAPLHGDPEKLQRMLSNLIQNAIRHTPPDGSVTVRVEQLPDAAEIEVADTGAGIEPGERERVFEPFYRAGPDASRTDSGAGLGLAIARAIVEAHGGRIWLDDAPGGTVVRIRLPLAA
jgi:signal transduction histidine kinase